MSETGGAPYLIVSPELRKAYENTTYRVDTPGGPAPLKVGELAPEVVFPTAEPSWRLVFVTSCNPFSNELSEIENSRRHERLNQVVLDAGYLALPGIGQDPLGQWPGEVSLAVLNPADADVNKWLILFEQYAVVEATHGSKVTLRFHPRVVSDTA